MKETVKLSATLEDYLEMVYFLREESGSARVGDIARRLGVKSPTVHAALRSLAEKGLVVHEHYGSVLLTRQGEKLAVEVKQKHEVLIRFLTEFLFLDRAQAEQEACGIEHAISDETGRRLVRVFEYLDKVSTKRRPEWLKGLGVYLRE